MTFPRYCFTVDDKWTSTIQDVYTEPIYYFCLKVFFVFIKMIFLFSQRKTKIGVMISFITMWLFLHYSLYELFSQRCSSTCYVNWFFRHDFVSKDVNNMKWLWNNTKTSVFFYQYVYLKFEMLEKIYSWYDVWFIFVCLGFILP